MALLIQGGARQLTSGRVRGNQAAQASAASRWLVAVAVVLGGCRPSPVTLRQGTISVTFKGEETCGLDNPYVTDAKGCKVLDRGALMCEGFGVIDGVLFAGGCEARATAKVLETRGTSPVVSSPNEDAASEEQAEPEDEETSAEP